MIKELEYLMNGKRSGTVQPREEKGQEHLTMYVHTS